MGTEITGGQIKDGTVRDADVASDAAIAITKLDSTVASKSYVDAAVAGVPWDINQFRLTLESGKSASTSDQSAKSTLYLTPIFNDGTLTTASGKIALLDSSGNVTVYTSAEVSLSLSLTSGSVYDVWAYNSSGTVTLETLVWTSGTARATAIAYNNGIITKSGDKTRRYVGTIYASGTNQCSDTLAQRYVWNASNRVRRPVRVVDSTDNWTYTTASYRQARASSANQFDLVCGLAGQASVWLTVYHIADGTATTQFSYTAIGEDSTSAKASNFVGGFMQNRPSGTSGSYSGAGYLSTCPAIGKHYYAWLEQGPGSGTTTWLGDSAGTNLQTGLSGWWES